MNQVSGMVEMTRGKKYLANIFDELKISKWKYNKYSLKIKET